LCCLVFALPPEQYRKRVDRGTFNLAGLHGVVAGIVGGDFSPAAASVSYVDADGDEIQIKTEEDLTESRVVMTEKVPPRNSLDVCVKIPAAAEADARKRCRGARSQKCKQKKAAETIGISHKKLDPHIPSRPFFILGTSPHVPLATAAPL
jgi:hypothetical protein